MLESELPILSQEFPPGFAREFDAHVYYDSGTRVLAAKLRESALLELSGHPVYIGDLRDECVGPHPMPMFELNFPASLLGEILLWLMSRRNGLSVLVHRVSGNDVEDHSEGALWLGTPVQLDPSAFG